jgi:hypothetical protein
MFSSVTIVHTLSELEIIIIQGDERFANVLTLGGSGEDARDAEKAKHLNVKLEMG